MPMYDYECPHCGEAFEDLRPIAERASAPCPKCDKMATKVLSSFFTPSSGGQDGPGRGGCMPGNLGGG